MNKASGGDGIPVELFQILKDDAVKLLHSIWQRIWKIQQWPQDWKRSVFIPIPKKDNAKEYSMCLLSCFSHVQLFVTPWTIQSMEFSRNGVGSHSLLQGIFLTQGPNPGFLHCRWILYQLSYQGSPTSEVSHLNP